MKKFYLLKAINPLHDDPKEYDIYGCFVSKKEAQAEKRRLQGLGFIKVYVKRNVGYCLYNLTRGL